MRADAAVSPAATSSPNDPLFRTLRIAIREREAIFAWICSVEGHRIALKCTSACSAPRHLERVNSRGDSHGPRPGDAASAADQSELAAVTEGLTAPSFLTCVFTVIMERCRCPASIGGSQVHQSKRSHDVVLDLWVLQWRWRLEARQLCRWATNCTRSPPRFETDISGTGPLIPLRVKRDRKQ